MNILTFTTLIFAAISGHALPHPMKRAGNATIDERTVLNFVLTLEHMENAFYTEALAKYDDQAFVDAGLPSFARERFVQIAEHEKIHVDYLTAALGGDATEPCQYNL
jgi:hypothetical protein